jgi:hypothetical protein
MMKMMLPANRTSIKISKIPLSLPGIFFRCFNTAVPRFRAMFFISGTSLAWVACAADRHGD